MLSSCTADHLHCMGLSVTVWQGSWNGAVMAASATKGLNGWQTHQSLCVHQRSPRHSTNHQLYRAQENHNNVISCTWLADYCHPFFFFLHTTQKDDDAALIHDLFEVHRFTNITTNTTQQCTEQIQCVRSQHDLKIMMNPTVRRLGLVLVILVTTQLASSDSHLPKFKLW